MQRAIAGAVGVLIAATMSVKAEPVPERKPGLWEITTVAADTGQSTIKVCIGAGDDIATPSGAGECTKPTAKRAGDTVIVDVVCTRPFGKQIMSTAYTGNFTDRYHAIMKITYDPPEGVKSLGVIIDGKYLGPDCAAAETR